MKLQNVLFQIYKGGGSLSFSGSHYATLKRAYNKLSKKIAACMPLVKIPCNTPCNAGEPEEAAAEIKNETQNALVMHGNACTEMHGNAWELINARIP